MNSRFGKACARQSQRIRDPENPHEDDGGEEMVLMSFWGRWWTNTTLRFLDLTDPRPTPRVRVGTGPRHAIQW
jgi:hypothetical protein